MPIGKVKWYDAEKGFGFVSNPGDEDVYVGRNVLPKGVEELFPGQRIDFDFAAGRRGPQALRVNSGRYPERKTGRQVAEILRAIAKDLDS